MRTYRKAVLVLACLAGSIPLYSQYFPQSGREALYQRALDVRARLNVLSISLQPGYEDLAALAYFRLGRGARIVSAYVTNGEAGESDVRGEYPNQLAAVRRSEAARAIALIDGEEYFLNMADLAAARDSAAVLKRWDVDTLQQKLGSLLASLRPDVILVARDWSSNGSSPERDVLVEALLRAIKKLQPSAAQKKAGGADEMFQWDVDRVLIETGSKGDVRLPLERVHPLWKRSYLSIGDEVAKAYKSLAVQREHWYGKGSTRTAITYEAVYPRSARSLKTPDADLPRPAPSNLKGLDTDISHVTGVITAGSMSSETRLGVLRQVAAIIDAVDDRLNHPLELSSQGRKICMQWKLSLENLRVSLLGIVVKFSIDPAIVTERQLSFLKIDTVVGMRPGDSAWVYFPSIDQKWLVDEKSQKMLPLRLDPPYRLLSPANSDHDLPAAYDGLSRTSVGKTWTYFVMCKAKDRERNFMYRGSIRMLYSERFSLEVLTPIVRAVPGERVIVRLTNHSRDGVRDSVFVNDSLATAAKQEFRLNVKDQWQIDTLVLNWKRPPGEGLYLLPVNIDIKTVGRFAVRSFEAVVDTGRQVALITGLDDSPTATTLRRLGLRWSEIRDARAVAERLSGFRVAILDRRALTLVPDLKTQVRSLREFVEQGGHLIVLSQDAYAWNASPIVEGLKLTSTTAWGEDTEVQIDSSNRMFTTPNHIVAMDWSGWLFRRAHNILDGTALGSASIPFMSQDGKNPFVAEWRIGSGMITYVDLALHPQFLNVHPGSFRLLANLVSY